MTTFRLVGNDTFILNARVLADFGHGEVGKITFSTDIATVKTGKTKNAVFASNASGDQATLEVRVLRGSDDDKFLNTQVTTYKSNPVGYTLMTGTITKKLGDGAGNIINDTFVLSGGVPSKNVEVTSNVEGDVEQAITIYTFQFASAARVIA